MYIARMNFESLPRPTKIPQFYDQKIIFPTFILSITEFIRTMEYDSIDCSMKIQK